jgi:heat shock protein HtpX
VPPIPFSLLVALALALSPAVAAWWTGRTVLARSDDPVLPELLIERRRRLTAFTTVGVVALALLFADEALWALPILWVALLLSARPMRRALFGEQLAPFAFLRYALSSAIARLGAWPLVATTPLLATYFAQGVAPNDPAAAVRAAAWVGGLFAVVAAVWQYNYSRVFLALHRATPLRRSAPATLMARLDAVAERAAQALVKRPEVYRYGAPGAYVMNAVAIPSRSHPAVALGDTLLATLTEDEIVAVFAHEIAHHEQFTRARWRRIRLRSLLLVLLIGALPALLVASVPSVAVLVSWFMPAALVIVLGKRTGGRRAVETKSDLRAVALTGGNADALVSALTKLHVYGRLPRRWPHAVERGATHPSLARRIQALRSAVDAMEHPEAQIAAPLTAFRSTTSGLVVAFDRDRAYWFEGVAADTRLELHALREAATSYRAIAYADLTELHVGVADAARSIDATDREGRSWRAPIAADEVAAVQAALDRVDVKLGHRHSAAPVAGATAVRWLALALLVSLGAAGELGVALLPIALLLVRPTLTAAVAATAAIALARVLLALPGIAWADPLRQISLLLTLGISVALIVQAARRARAETSRGNTRRLMREGLFVAGGLAAIAILGAASLWPLIAERPSSLVSHPAALLIVSLFFAAGGSLVVIPSRRWRAGGALLIATTLAGGAVLSGDGWLVRRTRPLAWATRRLTAHGAVHVPGGGLTITASPDGDVFAVSQYQPIRRGQPGGGTRYIIGRFADTPSVVRASTTARIAFVDDSTVIALDGAPGDSLEVRAERVMPNVEGGAAVIWRERIPSVDDPQLLLDRARRAWLVVARGEGDWSFVVATDTLGGSTPRVAHLGGVSPNDIGETMTQPLAAFGDGSAIWSTLPHLRGGGALAMPLVFVMAGSPRWEIRGSDGSGERFLADVSGFPACASEVDEHGALCVERTDRGTNIWRAPSARMLSRIATLPPVFDLVHGEATDAVAAAERFGQRAAVIDIANRRAYNLTLPGESSARAGMRWTADVLARGGYLLVLSDSRDGAIVTRYSIR